MRLDILPLAGHGLGLSEIRVFSEVNVTDWPDREVDLGGTSITAVLPGDRPSSLTARLSVAPNPANPGAVVTYALPRSPEVRLRLVEVRGRQVRTLVEGWRPAGAHRAFWDGRDDAGAAVASGMYLVLGEWEDGRMVGKVTLVR